MEKEAIIKDLIEYFTCFLNQDISIKDINTNLFLKPFNLKPSDLLFFYFDLQKKYEIKFNKDIILAGKFNTINNMSDIILQS